MNSIQPLKYLCEGRKLKYCAILATKQSFIIHAKFRAQWNDFQTLRVLIYNYKVCLHRYRLCIEIQFQEEYEIINSCIHPPICLRSNLDCAQRHKHYIKTQQS